MKNWLRKLRKDERGLTLVELLAVIVILAIVAAIAFVAIGNVIENSRKDAHVSNALQVISAAKIYEASGNDLGSVTAQSLQSGGYLDSLIDPWEKEEYDDLSAIEVTKTGDKYSIEFDDNTGKCSLDASEEDLIKDGRNNCTP